jgi:hypothetical protein
MPTATFSGVNLLVTLEPITCCHTDCGITFAAPDVWMRARRDDHSSWYCPNGHRQHFTGPTEEDKLRRKVAELQGNYDWMRESRDHYRGQLEHSDRSRRALKGTVTKMRKRAIAGMCQFCRRTFAHVQRHVESQHPGVSTHDDERG